MFAIAALRSTMSSDEDIAGDMPDERAPPPRAPVGKKRSREPTSRGELRLFVVLASAVGLWHGVFPEQAPSCTIANGVPVVVGLALARWAWLPGGQAEKEPLKTFAERLRRTTQARQIKGYIGYEVVRVAKLRNTFETGAKNIMEILAQIQSCQVFGASCSQGSTAPASTVSDVLAVWRREHGALPKVPVWLTPPLACKVVAGAIAIMHMVAATARLCRKSLLLQKEPSRRQLRALIDAASATTDALVLSRSWRPSTTVKYHKLWHDPELVLEWLETTAFVKDIRNIHSASQAFAKLFARRLKKPVAEL